MKRTISHLPKINPCLRFSQRAVRVDVLEHVTIGRELQNHVNILRLWRGRHRDENKIAVDHKAIRELKKRVGSNLFPHVIHLHNVGVLQLQKH